MKKLFALLMVLSLMLVSVAAFAETAEPTAEPTTVNWADYEAKAENYPGHFYAASDTGLEIYIPDTFKDSEISDELKEKGTIMLLKTEDEKAVVNCDVVAVDLNTFINGITAQGRVITPLVLNGVNFYEFTVDPGVVLAIGTEQGGTLTFAFSATDSEAYKDVFQLMAASLRPASAK